MTTIFYMLLTKWNRVLINTSGSGKTRLGLHGLCHHWGFYGVLNEIEDGIGSRDLWDLMSLDDSPSYSFAKRLGSSNKDAALHMDEKVTHRVYQFLLGRFLFLNLLILEASNCEGGLRSRDHRLLWVLLQAQPFELFKRDPFVEIINALRIASVEDLRVQIREEFLKFEPTLQQEFTDHSVTDTTRRPLYCFLDEVQNPTMARMGEYRSSDTNEERPLMRPIWRSMTGIFGSTDMLVILSGTAMNEVLLTSVLTSSAFKPPIYHFKRNIGAFDDPETQRHYIECYLLDDHSSARQEFLKRAWGWCRGR